MPKFDFQCQGIFYVKNHANSTSSASFRPFFVHCKCLLDLLTSPFLKGFENFLILSMIVIFPE